MLTLIKQEWMKALKQNRFYVWAIIAFLMPIVTLVWFIPAETQTIGYMALGGAKIVVAIAGSVIAALTFTQEFSYGTIRPLLSRQYSRFFIFLSKIIMIVCEYVIVLLSAIFGTLIGRFIFQMLNGKNGTEIDWQPFFFSQVMDVLMTLFFFAVVLLVANMVKSSAAAVSLGIVMSVATSIIAALTTFLVQFFEPLKWNPFTVESLLANFDGTTAHNQALELYFGANISIIWVVYLLYLAAIYALTFLIFQRRSV
ncbi:ABC transporter permease [Fructobacillus sp. M1-13]|uniref:ABC transporter permease subunit n=1 Tax=Fructobacillus papyriferae TaxID=2713171 RepID=A0ABS5QPN1_9LACO|nr:ABC transporter permease [Fructobacillus papyriferae]MBS9335139.1 ABC transporter permease subunit [Fructobacillus papyriferae]MCD2159191.1 ABC transporter permease [Fructobacillus papyriferae]